MLFKIGQIFLYFENNLNCFQLKLDVNISFAEIYRNIYQLTMLSHGNWDKVTKICSCGYFNSLFLLFFHATSVQNSYKYYLTDHLFLSDSNQRRNCDVECSYTWTNDSNNYFTFKADTAKNTLQSNWSKQVSFSFFVACGGSWGNLCFWTIFFMQ